MVKVTAEVGISVVADTVQEAVEYASNLNVKEIIQPADESCDMADWENLGVSFVGNEAGAFKK